jgi:CheY-like chemotaxis protein
MPRMGGIDLLGWIAAEPRFNDLPVVVLTSSSDPAEVTKAFRFGAKGYLTKPVDFTALQDVAQVIMRYWVASLVPVAAK